MNLVIRMAGVEDVGTLAALNQVVQELHVEAEPGQFRADTNVGEVKGFFLKLVSSENDMLLIAEHDQVPVGYVWFERQERPASPLTNARRRLYIHHVVVIHGARDQGVGTALLRASEAEAETLGIRQVAVDMWTFNKGAQAFFRAANFQPFQVVMRKEIGESAQGRQHV